jgi:hypothetical protein
MLRGWMVLRNRRRVLIYVELSDLRLEGEYIVKKKNIKWKFYF